MTGNEFRSVSLYITCSRGMMEGEREKGKKRKGEAMKGELEAVARKELGIIYCQPYYYSTIVFRVLNHDYRPSQRSEKKERKIYEILSSFSTSI